MESVKIKNLFLLECSMHSRASSMARALAVKMSGASRPNNWSVSYGSRIVPT